MRRFFSVTRSACSKSRTTVGYRAVFKGLQIFMFVCGQMKSWGWREVFGLSCLLRNGSTLRIRRIYAVMAYVKPKFYDDICCI
jgi:hypothetical protein